MDILRSRIKHYSQLFSSVYFDKLALIHTFDFAHMEEEDNGKEIYLQPFILQVILYLTKKFTKDQCRRKNDSKKWHVENM